jgi:1-acyl-sn-glycerol-3-phosphate acyltransferase
MTYRKLIMYLPTIKRNWFLFTCVTNLIALWSVLKVVNILPDSIISRTRKQEISSYISCFFARIVFYLNPHIQVKALNNWNMVRSDGPNIFLINHTSPIDAFLFAAMLPLKYAGKLRTLFKAELFNVPLFGEITRYCGHFPVHFARSELNNFSVDKEKQAKVLDDIKRHLDNGGHIAFFPEGQLNRSDTSKLQPFRRGLFEVFSEFYAKRPAGYKNLDMYCFLHSGLDITWHPEAKLGGNPSEVKYLISPLLFSDESQLPEIQNTVQANLNMVTASPRPVARL